jgi:hypothetical protein
MNELVIKQTCFYKVKVSSDDIKNDRVLENINTHPIELCQNSELLDVITVVKEDEDDNS